MVEIDVNQTDIKLYYKILDETIFLGTINIIAAVNLYHELHRDPEIFVDDEYNHNFTPETPEPSQLFELRLKRDAETYIFDFPNGASLIHVQTQCKWF